MAFTYIVNGTGTEQDPYLIENADCLKELLNTNVDCSNFYFKQTDDITLNDLEDFENWIDVAPSYIRPTPSATNLTNANVYDGDNHTIYGLYADTSYDNRMYFLFNTANKICNLKIKKSLILIKNFNCRFLSVFADNCFNFDNCETDTEISINGFTDTSYGLYVSVFCNNNADGEFKANNCKYYGNVKFKNSSGNCRFTGLFNIANNNFNNTNITYINKCCNIGSFISENSKVIEFDGVAYSATFAYYITECFNAMSFRFNYPNYSYRIDAYGLGRLTNSFMATDSYVLNSYNIGNLINETGSIANIAFCGITNGKANNCYNFGKIHIKVQDRTDTCRYVGSTGSENCYYCADDYDFTKENKYGASELTIDDFLKEESFTNWNFDDIWVIKEDRPHLMNNSENISSDEDDSSLLLIQLLYMKNIKRQRMYRR